MNETSGALVSVFDDAFIVEGARTPFVDYNGAFLLVSPIELGIKAGREALERAEISGGEIGAVVAGNMAQASFDAYFLPRHIGLYCGARIEVPALLVQRICGSGVEAIAQVADAVSLGRAEVALCVGAESMSRNPIAAYTHRGGFRMGQVAFKDFLWEALFDPSCDASMGGTAENLAKRYAISRDEVDAFAARSFARALEARAKGFFDDEIVAVADETFALEGYNPRVLKLKGKGEVVREDSHVRPSPLEALAKIRPAFGGVQTGGNSSAVVDGAAGVVVASGKWLKAKAKTPLARVLACAAVHGHRPGCRHSRGLRARRDRPGRNRPHRDQRGFRRASHRLLAGTRARRGQAQRQRRRHRHRPSPRGDRGAPRAHRLPPIAARGLALWRRFGLYRRRTGHRDDRRKSGRRGLIGRKAQ